MTAPHNSITGITFTPCTPTRYPGLYVWRQDRGLWRHVIDADEPGDAFVTGPPYRTKGEALADLPAAAERYDLTAA